MYLLKSMFPLRITTESWKRNILACERAQLNITQNVPNKYDLAYSLTAVIAQYEYNSLRI